MNQKLRLNVLKTLLLFLESEILDYEIIIDKVNRKVIEIKSEFPFIYQCRIIYNVEENKLWFQIENSVQICNAKYQIFKHFYHLYCKFQPPVEWVSHVSIAKNGLFTTWSAIHLEEIEELNIELIEHYYHSTLIRFNSFFIGVREIYQSNKTAEEAMAEVQRKSNASIH